MLPPYHTRMSTWLFDWIAPFYDQFAEPLMVGNAQRAVGLLELTGRERILDVAGGTGALARLITERTRAHVTVLDASRGMLNQLPRHPRIQAVHSPAHSLPFHSESFDWVVCTAAFHWLTPHAVTLAAIRRVLKPNGRLLIVDFDRGGLAGPLLDQTERLFRLGAAYLTQPELAALLLEQGFEGRFFPFNLVQYGYIGAKTPL